MLYILIGFVIIAFVYDSKTSRIPNWLNFSGLILGVMINLILLGIEGLIFSVLGVLLGFSIMLVLYFLGAVGAGDVKLFAAIGSMVGAHVVFNMMCYSLLYAGAIGLAILLYRRILRKTLSKFYTWFVLLISTKQISTYQEIKKQKNLQFPFMYAVVPAFTTVYLLYLY